MAGLLGLAMQGPALAGEPALEPTAQGPVETQSPVRDRIVLNGLWKVLPAVGPSADAPVGDWGTIWVPGSWLGGFATSGKSSEWDIPKGTKIEKVWYDRQIDIPASWKGREVVLDFEQVSTDAKISVNGKDCGTVSWPYGQVDITQAVTPGSTAELRVLVSATVDQGAHALPMGPGQAQQLHAANKLSSAGLIGEVFLLSRPQGPAVSDVFVQPSVRKKQVTLQIEVTGITADETATLSAAMMNASGQAEQTFTGSLPLHAAPVQTATVTFPWPNPTLWSPEHPNLYTLQLKVDGTTLHDIYPQQFGFREFWIEGKKFFLNGQEIRLRPNMLGSDAPWTIEGIDGYIDGLRKAGFNIVEQQPIDLFERGVASQQREIWCERADLKGFLNIADAVDFDSYLTKDKNLTWWDPGVRDKYKATFELDSRRYRNHPSVVMYTTTPNRYGQFQDQNPRTIGVREIEFPLKAFQLQDIHMKAGLDAMSVIREVDPTRPAYSHAGDMLGDVYTVNNYLDLQPLQEREEWLSNYAEKADMPYMAVEFGLPLAAPALERGRSGYVNSVLSEPLATEFCAIYLGPDSYKLEPDIYRACVSSKFDGKHSYTSFHNNALLDQNPSFQELEALFIRNTYRSWRTAGVTGGMIPWGLTMQVYKSGPAIVPHNPPFQPGQRGGYRDQAEKVAHFLDTTNGYAATPSSDAFLEVNGPTLAWITGAPDNFYEKSHSFRVGQKVTKQICLINDLAGDDSAYHVDWKVTVGGATLHEESADGKVAAATNTFLPISFTLPGTITGEKVDGEIEFSATIGGRTSSDKFPFRVFHPNTGNLPKMFVFDPQGQTSDLLKNLGADAIPWKGEDASSDRPLLVIGRRALSGTVNADGKTFAEVTPSPGDLEKFVNSGGRLLVMTQDSTWMQKYAGFRINRAVSRRFFPVMNDHPIIAGLDADDFRDWAGAGTLVDARPTYSLDSFSDYGWHWGNQGSVSSAAVEIPHLSGWTPILSGEFDLAYSPLMQLSYGSGLAVLCTLDLEDQASLDPVAEIAARRILQQAVALVPTPRRKTVYLGGDDDATLLKNMGVTFDQATTLPSPDELAIIGAGATVTTQDLTNFANQGGNILVLPAPAGQNAAGDTIANQDGFYGVTEFQSSFNTPLAGLSVSDLHFRTGLSWPVLTKGGTLAAGGLISTQAAGKGTIVGRPA